ncbi:GNAT family N-acetyltransferase [Aeromonas salmonicida]|uniref:GNAT family N-acetyltransferase n=1 Tax=Aeromonas salmonicida TaxID=645 RepID=UPI0035A57D84
MNSRQGGELRLDPITTADLPHIYRGLSDPEVIAHYGISYDSLTACEAQMAWYADLVRQGTGGWFLIRSQHTDLPMGAIGYNDADPQHRKAELGYWLYPEYWGKGVMGRALPLFLTHFYGTTRLHRLQALVEEPNIVSARVLLGAGFRYEGTARECEWKGEQFISLQHYALLRSDQPGAR